jgi:hypothetical protein
MNKVGVAGWFHHYAKDIHVADTERQKFEVGVEMADIGYRWSLEEIGQAMMIPGMNLSGRSRAAARRAYEEFVDNVAINGDSDKNFFGHRQLPGRPHLGCRGRAQRGYRRNRYRGRSRPPMRSLRT